MSCQTSIRIVIALGLLWINTAASAVANTMGVVGAQQQMLGALVGERQLAPGNFQMSWQLPAKPQFATATVEGGGDVIYYLQGSTIRVPGEQLPALHGRLPVTKEMPDPPHIIARGRPESIVEVQWGMGRDVTCRGLGVVVEVRDAVSGDLLATVQQDAIALTTGTVLVDGQPVAGQIDIQQMLVQFVGTFPMPATGNKKIDAQLAGQPVLMRLTASAKQLQ